VAAPSYTACEFYSVVSCSLGFRTEYPRAQEYVDSHSTYRDVATTLYQFSTISPRTEVYSKSPLLLQSYTSTSRLTGYNLIAHEDGRPQLLLHLSGTIPVVFRGATYNIPLTIWLPHEYPKKPPMAFVTTVKDMLIRPGNHVDPSGRCYHPYLANWVNYSDVGITIVYCVCKL
jgi:ESCRT-I complex subunit TSG101